MITHSSCPQKRDIRAPEFALVETLNATASVLRVYQCAGCGERITVASPREGEAPARILGVLELLEQHMNSCPLCGALHSGGAKGEREAMEHECEFGDLLKEMREQVQQ
jgi:hypothetical protein